MKVSMGKFMNSNVIKHELNMMSCRADSSSAEDTLWKSFLKYDQLFKHMSDA